MNEPVCTPLKVIPHPDGDILHGMKKQDPFYNGFGEAYFSFVHCNKIKAWKKHTVMRTNLIVPLGEVKFIVIDDSDQKNHKIFQFVLNQENYQRLTIPNNLWFGFKGLGKKENIILNIADIEHDPAEVERKEINEFAVHW